MNRIPAIRKVLIKKWVQPIYDENNRSVRKEGTGQYSDFIHEAAFHQWGINWEDTSNSVAHYSVAIVEYPDGTIDTIHPSHLKFIS